MRNLMDDGDFVKALQMEFVKPKVSVNKAVSVDKAYHHYSNHSVPKLTKSNAITLIQYVRKYKIPEKDLGQVIGKISKSNHPMLSRNDVRKIYDQGFADAEKASQLDKSTVTAIYKWIFNYIAFQLATGHNVRVSGFGKFERYYEQARKFYSLTSGQMQHSASHYVPKFRPSLTLKKKLLKRH